MQVDRIPGANRVHGAPENWDESRGEILGLPTRDEEDPGSGLFFMVSQFTPSAEELEILNAGGSIRIGISCDQHPVLRIPYVVEKGAV